MRELLYLAIALFSTTAGALTGMGGGVIIKPVLDLAGHYDAASINALSSLTVLIMAVVSVARLWRGGVEAGRVIPLAIGAIAGGNAGKLVFSAVLGGGDVTGIQNITLAALIVPVIYFMRHRDRMPRVANAGAVAAVVVGAGLGFFSSFLGIGGGPFNVIAIMIVLSVDAKPAAAYSLVVILFSQLASLGLSLARGGYANTDLSMLPYMAVAAVAGGFIGARLQTSFSNERVARLFNAVQFLVLALCIVNAFRNLSAAE